MTNVGDSWLVYMIQTKSGKLYTGITNDLPRRLAQHQAGKKGAKFFRISSMSKLIYLESCADRSSALKREYQLKALTRKAKWALIEQSANGYCMVPPDPIKLSCGK